MKKTDLIIIGSGPGGYHTAGYAAKMGMQVVIIEKGFVGGTCLNEGCIPTKCLAHDAEMYRNPVLSCVGGGMVDFPRIMERKNKVVAQLREGVETLLSQPGILLVEGTATFKDAHTVCVGAEEFTAPNIIVATGSHSKFPPVKGLKELYDNPADNHILTSTELLSISHVPQKLCIIGAGVIGMEFASAFNTFGSEVTMVEFMKECLPPIDSDIAKRLRKSMEKRGVTFYLQSGVKSVELNEEGNCVVTFSRKGKDDNVEADTVLVATGRGVNTSGLNLESAGVEYDGKGIHTDANYQTNVEGVYAIGDVNGKTMLAHAAIYQGIDVIDHILGKQNSMRLDVMPAAVFTYPEAASVGLTENQCKDQGIEYICKKGFYRSNGKALAMEETEGMVKIIAEASTGKIIGCHVYGAHAADLVQEVSSLMCRDTTIKQLQGMVHIHPTLGEILADAAAQA